MVALNVREMLFHPGEGLEGDLTKIGSSLILK